MDRGARQATVHGIAESKRVQLSMHTRYKCQPPEVQTEQALWRAAVTPRPRRKYYSVFLRCLSQLCQANVFSLYWNT